MYVQPWGKFCKEDKKTHHLAHHCADVAACFEALIDIPTIRSRFEQAAERNLCPADIARLSMIAFLHDVGKLHPDFQAQKWLSEQIIPQQSKVYKKSGHSGQGKAIFFSRDLHEKIGFPLLIQEIIKWGCESTICGLLNASFAHHGRPIRVENSHCQRWNKVPKTISYDSIQAAKNIGDQLRIWFSLGFSESVDNLPDNPRFQHIFAGFVNLADWLGSDRKHFHFVEEFNPHYIDEARLIAKRFVTEIGLNVKPVRDQTPRSPHFDSVFPGLSPRSAQATVGTFNLEDPLLILEAETGSGKTEAALWHFARLFAAGKVDGLYFALPTRAAAKQLHARINHATKILFGNCAPETVLAVPGYIKAGDHEGVALPEFKVRWDDQEAKSEESIARRWAAENAKRFLAATIAVGTVDQAMLSALQVKHAHLRSAALSRSLIVIDEVHASDTYMMKVQKILLDTHLACGGYAMLMSATLGASARTDWLGKKNTIPELNVAIETPYPAVWGSISGLIPVQPDKQKKSVQMSLENSWEAEHAAKLAIDAAKKKAKVLVIRNTVTKAIETFHAVCDAGAEELLFDVEGKPTLHHSRFAAEDRQLLDIQLETVLSSNNALRKADGKIVIGTQTVEQSLDICADFLISDLCPSDVLLQRIGRLHRHQNLIRPESFKNPHCKVLCPVNGLDELAKPSFENGLGLFAENGGGIYRNLHAVELTRQLIKKHPQWVLPTMNRIIVENAVHPDAIETLNHKKGEIWKNYADKVFGTIMAERGIANNVILDTSKSFGIEMFVSVEEEEVIRTRLGAEGSQIKFALGTVGPFGRKVTTVTCPSHWKGIIAEGLVETSRSDNNTLKFTVGDVKFLYSTDGLKIAKA